MRAAVVFYLLWLFMYAATAQNHKHGHEDGLPDFYAKWLIPNPHGYRSSSCCNERDCYPAPIRLNRELGRYEFLRREDKRWFPIPPSILEQNQPDPRESPDGASHVCAQPPGINDRVYCAVLGSAI